MVANDSELDVRVDDNASTRGRIVGQIAGRRLDPESDGNVHPHVPLPYKSISDSGAESGTAKVEVFIFSD
ncbi:uncharacterized protein N7483_004065 [Penicillium malachiteum]|uniref:uncharacterized protein n=1 Tax=Penicillium malachiteum TaxID=1324776 RepID=UPI00254941F9|nr:uncharacterized protein N7483_004065 [Penicillium malachiteum]KAJ5729557.1 hypothetical protein N7483_004065 [Penicillium malachiteum]